MTVMGRVLGSLALSAGFVACAAQPPAHDAGSPPADTSAAGSRGVGADTWAGTSSLAEGSGGAAGSHAAGGNGAGGVVARDPEVPLLPYPADPFDPEALRALRQRLPRVAARVAPHARPAGQDIAGKLGTGQRLERSYAVAKGCYTAVGIAETGGIVDLGLELVNEATPNEVLTDAGKGDTAVVGQPPACLRVNSGGELRLVISAVSGAGLAAAQLYGR